MGARQQMSSRRLTIEKNLPEYIRLPHPRGKTRVYISATIDRHTRATNKKIADVLTKDGTFSVYLPQTFVPDMDHAKLERWAPEYCKKYINHADIILLVIDNYGKDCSWEIGFACHASKTIVGFASDPMGFERHRKDWMIKNELHCVITTSHQILKLCRRDLMLTDIDVYEVQTIKDLPRHLLAFYHRRISLVGETVLKLNL